MEDSTILVKQEGHTGVARVVGKGSFKNARHLKQYVEMTTAQGTQDVVIDLQECIHMDSTFMGVLAGMAAERRKSKRSLPKIINSNARNLELLQTLGLDRILDIQSPVDNSASTDNYQPVQTTPPVDEKTEIAETMLKAHQNLVDVNPQNSAKFQDVISFLKTKLEDSGRSS